MPPSDKAGKEPRKIPDALKRHSWKKGQSGNPVGRPKGSVNLTSRMKKRLLQGDNAEDVIDAWMRMIIVKHNVAALALLLDRIDGKLEGNTFDDLVASIRQISLTETSTKNEKSE